MHTTNLPRSRSVDDLNDGSLVSMPHENRWAFKTDRGLFTIDNRRPSNVNGKVADFGTDFKISIDVGNVARASYPFVATETPPGTLIVFEDDGVATQSVVLSVDVHSRAHTLDLPSGRIQERGQGSGEGLAYSEWSIKVKVSDDDYETIYEHPVPQQE